MIGTSCVRIERNGWSDARRSGWCGILQKKKHFAANSQSQDRVLLVSAKGAPVDLTRHQWFCKSYTLPKLRVTKDPLSQFFNCGRLKLCVCVCVLGKVFCKVIQKRLAEKGSMLLRGKQCGLHAERGCIDSVFSLRVLAEKAREYNTPLSLCFVDLRKAYDSVNHDALWVVLKNWYWRTSFSDVLVTIDYLCLPFFTDCWGVWFGM